MRRLDDLTTICPACGCPEVGPGPCTCCRAVLVLSSTAFDRPQPAPVAIPTERIISYGLYHFAMARYTKM